MNSRKYFFAGFLAAAGALAFAYYLQYAQGLEPCSMCILQRVAMLGVAVFCLLGFLHGPRGWGRRVYAVPGSLCALAGAAIAARHVWIMHLPASDVPACGAGLKQLMNYLPWQQAVMIVLQGDADCANVKGSFLGVSLPAWTLVYFIILLIAGLLGVFMASNQARRQTSFSD